MYNLPPLTHSMYTHVSFLTIIIIIIILFPKAPQPHQQPLRVITQPSLSPQAKKISPPSTGPSPPEESQHPICPTPGRRILRFFFCDKKVWRGEGG